MVFRQREVDSSGDASLVIGRRGDTLLRRSNFDDREEFIAVRKASAELHAPWISPSAPDLTGEDDRGFSHWCGDLETDRRRVFFVCRATDGALAGGIALSEIVRGAFQSAYCGYWGAAALGGRGHMTAGLSLLLDHAFDRFSLHRVEANIQPGNERSLALVRRLGFRLEGFSPRYLRINGAWCDHERWAMLAEDWRDSRAVREFSAKGSRNSD